MLTSRQVQDFLRSIEPFKSLPGDDLTALVSKCSEKKFLKNKTIFSEGDIADSVWVLYSGRVQIFKYTKEGRPFAIESLGPGELFGALCRLGGNGRSYPCTAVSSDSTVSLKIADQTFLEYYSKNPGMMRGVCALCSDRLKDVQDMRCLGQESVLVRVATILMRLHLVHGEIIPFTKREVSELIGATIETTFRAMSELQKKGLIISHRGKIEVRKPDEIRKLSDQRP